MYAICLPNIVKFVLLFQELKVCLINWKGYNRSVMRLEDIKTMVELRFIRDVFFIGWPVLPLQPLSASQASTD